MGVITMEHWRSDFVEANGIRLHYTRTGGHGPPLVLAHGVTDNGLCWSPVAEALAPGYDVIMADARGHGLSDAPERGYTPADQAADLAGLITALGLRRPILLGHSMGAITTLVLAGTYPELPRAILLEDPPPWWQSEATPSPEVAERMAGIKAWLTLVKSKTREELLAENRAESPHWSEAERRPWAESKLQFSPHIAEVVQPGNAVSVDWPAVLGRVSCPALLITADPGRGAATAPEQAEALRATLPQLQVAHITGAGHSIRRDQLGPYLGAVRAFLASLPA
jgi:N-formylmaleamate deformylase